MHLPSPPDRRFRSGRSSRPGTLGLIGLMTAIAVVLGGAVADLTVTQTGTQAHAPAVAVRTVLPPPPATAPAVGPTPAGPPTVTAAPVVEAYTPLAARVIPKPRVHAEPVAVLLAATALPAGTVHQIAALPGASVLSLGAATYTIAGKKFSAVSADPAALRAVVPSPSADSDALWASLARGDVIESYEGRAAKFGTLGGPLIATSGATTARVRLGGRAGFGFSNADLVVSPQRGAQIGLVPGAGLLVSADPGTLPAALAQQVGKIAAQAHVGYTPLGQAAASTVIAGGGTWIGLYQRAATTCSGLPWQVLAAIGQVESGHGRNDGPSSAGAVGPMQFLPSTFATVAVDGDHDGKLSPWDPFDAVYSAAHLLCLDGAGSPGGLHDAIFAYNHAEWYVQEVLALAARY